MTQVKDVMPPDVTTLKRNEKLTLADDVIGRPLGRYSNRGRFRRLLCAQSGLVSQEAFCPRASQPASPKGRGLALSASAQSVAVHT